MTEKRQVFSLRQVVSSIKKTIEERYQQTYWVKAEMHKLNLYPSGHAFPELVQKENGKVIAQLSGTIWKHHLDKINLKFVQVLKEPIKEGSTLLMEVKINFSEIYGISLAILDIDLNYTLGELQRERQETLSKLHSKGLLNKNQQVPFPLLPQRIAVISADSSKGLSDFMQVLNQNNFNYAFFTYLFPAYLQGDLAAPSIMKQLQRIEKVKHHFDVIVIVRGGGGEVGLSCYNNFELCQAIANSSLPVLTGIGHSTNLTVAEMIAYRNAITPTELADYLIQAFHEFSVPVERSIEKLKNLSTLILEQAKQDFKQQVQLLKSNATTNLKGNRTSWHMLSRQLNAKSILLIERQQHHVHYLQKQLINQAKLHQQAQSKHISDLSDYFIQQARKIVAHYTEQIELQSRHIQMLDPKNVLKRGFSITRYQQKTISQKNVPQKDDLIEIETYDLKIRASVQ